MSNSLRAVVVWLWVVGFFVISLQAKPPPFAAHSLPNTSTIKTFEGPCSMDDSSPQNLEPREGQTFPPWRFEDQFEFDESWPSVNEMNIIRQTFVGIIDMLTVTFKVLDGDPWVNPRPVATNTSFLRYFNPGDLDTFVAVLARVWVVLGAPRTDGLRQCIAAPKLHLVYGDFEPDKTSYCTKFYAYHNFYTNVYGDRRSYISFCPRFFLTYRSYDSVERDRLGTSIDPGNPTRFAEADTGAAMALHELLHWPAPLRPVLLQQIVDLKVVRPDDKTKRRAYGAFYAMHVKDWGRGKSPLLNADNYVFCVLEIFYRNRFSLPPWEDPPDPLASVQGPDDSGP